MPEGGRAGRRRVTGCGARDGGRLACAAAEAAERAWTLWRHREPVCRGCPPDAGAHGHPRLPNIQTLSPCAQGCARLARQKVPLHTPKSLLCPGHACTTRKDTLFLPSICTLWSLRSACGSLEVPCCQTLGKVWPAPRVCDGTLRGQQAVHFMKQYGANQVVYCSAAASDDEPSTPPAQAPASMSAADPLLLDAARQELAPVRHARLLVRARLLARPPLAQGLEAVFWVVASGWLGKAWQGLRIEEFGTLVLHQAAGFAS